MVAPWENPVTLARAYKEAGNAEDAGKILGCSERTVREHVRKTDGIELRAHGRPPSEKTNDPVRYALENDDGYPIVEAWVPTDDGDRKRHAVQLHRLVAVAEWGFSAVVDNEVHHKDGMKLHCAGRNLVPLGSRAHALLEWDRRWHQPWVGAYSRGEDGP
jgi:hypothetical protein